MIIKVNDKKEFNRIVKKNDKNWPKIYIDDESECWPDDWEDYKTRHIPNNCSKCGYLVCVCKPIVNQNREKHGFIRGCSEPDVASQYQLGSCFFHNLRGI